ASDEVARPPAASPAPPPAVTVRPAARAQPAPQLVGDRAWSDYQRDGYLRLGRLLELDEVAALCQRADDLALGHLRNPGVQMQLDTGGPYDELADAVPAFAEGTRLYRKLQGLETDPLFARLLHHPLFAEICARQYGPH